MGISLSSIRLDYMNFWNLCIFFSDEKSQDKKESKFWLDPEEFTLRKRLPPSLPKRHSDVYVTNKTNFKAQLNRYDLFTGSYGDGGTINAWSQSH